MTAPNLAALERQYKRKVAARDKLQAQRDEEAAEARREADEAERAEQELVAAVRQAQQKAADEIARANADARQAEAALRVAERAHALDEVNAATADLPEAGWNELADVYDPVTGRWFNIDIATEARRIVRQRLGFDVPEVCWEVSDPQMADTHLWDGRLWLRVARQEGMVSDHQRPQLGLEMGDDSGGLHTINDLADLARILLECPSIRPNYKDAA